MLHFPISPICPRPAQLADLPAGWHVLPYDGGWLVQPASEWHRRKPTVRAIPLVGPSGRWKVLVNVPKFSAITRDRQSALDAVRVLVELIQMKVETDADFWPH
jgi:hypothetical protein